MAIEQFAESLLADVRKRNRDRQKEMERDQRKALLGSIGLGIARQVGNKLLAQQTKDFLNSTEFRSAAQVARTADQIAAENTKTWGLIEASNQNPLQYLIERNKPLVQNEMSSTTPYSQRGTQHYEGTIYEVSKKMAQDQLKQLEAIREIVRNNDLGKDEQRLLLAAKENRPATVEDFFIGKLTSLVSGRDGDDVDMREMLALEDFINDQDPKSRGYLTELLKHKYEEFNRSGSLVKASEYARDLMSNKGDPAEEIITRETPDFVEGANGVIFQVVVKQDYKPQPDGTLVAFGKPSREVARDDNGDAIRLDLKTEKERIRAEMEVFNWQDFANKNLKGAAYQALFQGLRDIDVGSLAEIDTYEEFAKFQNIFFDIATNPEAYELEDVGLAFVKSGLEEWHTKEGARLQAKISAAEGRNEDTSDLVTEYNKAFVKYYRNLQEQAAGLPISNRPLGTLAPDDEEDDFVGGYELGATRQL